MSFRIENKYKMSLSDQKIFKASLLSKGAKVLYPSRKLKISFLFELILASLKTIPLLVGIKLGFSFNQSILVYVIFSCVGYALFIAKIINTSKNKYLITD